MNDPMPVERWLPVAGWETLYLVSDHGRVWSTRFQRVVAQAPNSQGYPYVKLHHNGERVRRGAHSLVLEAFVGPRPAGQEACHWGTDKNDTRLENLRWDTHSANQLDKRRHGTHHESIKAHCPRAHELMGANLDATALRRGWRECLACRRARGDARRRRKRGELVVDTYATADAHYARIMGS